MKRYTWRTREDGMIAIQDAPGVAEVAPSLSGADAQLMDRIEADWGGLCDVYAELYDLPRGWLQAMVFRESRGNARAFLREPNGWTGVGLLQITYPALKGAHLVEVDGKKQWVGGKTDDELMVPSVNLEVGAKYVSSHWKLYGNDFPRHCAAFNAGTAHPALDAAHDNPWSLHSTGDHISREVAALNYWISRFGEVKPEGHTGPIALIDLTDMARHLDDEARKEPA